jgi:hypothetical protein
MGSAAKITGEQKWWLSASGSARGPYSTAYVVAILLTNKIPTGTLACPAGTEEWRAVRQWPEFSEYVADLPPNVPPQSYPNIRELGLGSRHLQRAIAAALVKYALSVISICMGPAETSGVKAFLDMIVGLLLITVSPYLIYAVWKTSKALNASLIWLLVACPWLGLLGAFVFSRRANRLLRAAGIKVGLMGPAVLDLPA